MEDPVNPKPFTVRRYKLGEAIPGNSKFLFSETVKEVHPPYQVDVLYLYYEVELE